MTNEDAVYQYARKCSRIAPERAAECVARARAGDKTAYKDLLDGYMRLIVKMARGFTGRNHLFDDYVQEAFFVLVACVDGYKEPGDFGAYFTRALRNKYIATLGDETRTFRPAPAFGDDAEPAEEFVEDVGARDEIDGLVSWRDPGMQALKRMDRRDAFMFMLAAGVVTGECESLDTVGAVLGKSRNEVFDAMRKAREQHGREEAMRDGEAVCVEDGRRVRRLSNTGPGRNAG